MSWANTKWYRSLLHSPQHIMYAISLFNFCQTPKDYELKDCFLLTCKYWILVCHHYSKNVSEMYSILWFVVINLFYLSTFPFSVLYMCCRLGYGLAFTQDSLAQTTVYCNLCACHNCRSCILQTLCALYYPLFKVEI